MNRTEKQALIDDLHAEFGKSPHAILVDFRGLTVPAVTEFRRKVRQSGSKYRVVKNSLALRAVKDTPLAGLAAKFENTTGVAYTGTFNPYDDCDLFNPAANTKRPGAVQCGGQRANLLLWRCCGPSDLSRLERGRA